MKKPIVIGLAVVAFATVVAGGYWQYRSRQDDGLTLYSNIDIHTVSLSFRVGGRTELLAVDEGDVIKTGQVLGELGHKLYEIALTQAKVGVLVAQAQCDLMLTGYRSGEIAQAAAMVKQAQTAYDYVQNFYNRQQGLQENRTISANDLESARSSRDQTQATLKSVQDKLRQCHPSNREQDIAQAEVSLGQAQAQLIQAESNLQDSTLIAPPDGTLLTRAVEPSTVFNEGGTVFTVSLTCPVWVRAYVDGHNPDQTQPGRRVLLYTDGRPDKPYHGQIGFASPIAEFIPKTVETPDLRIDFIYRLRIVAADADDVLHRGMSVTVQFGDEAGHE